MKTVAKNQNVRLTKCGPSTLSKKAEQTLNKPLLEILRTARHLFHFPSRELREND
jgi:hypothetical protein